MKFAENNRISHRQLYRQMILTFLAPFLVCLPGKNGIQGMNGFWGIVLAVSVLILYVFILLRVTSGYSDMVRFLGSFWGRIAGVFFLVYIIFTAVYILKILEQIIPRWLLMGIPSGWISFLVIVVCSIGTEKGIQRRGRMAALVFGLSLLEVSGIAVRTFYRNYLETIFVPGLLFIQVLLLFCGRKRKTRKTTIVALMAFILALNGCAGIEPEKRMYPLALGAEWSEDGWTLIYGMPELPSAEGQEKEESQNSVLSIKGNDFDEIEKIYNRSQEKYLDMGHLQVLILKNQLVQSEHWKELLAYLEKEPLIGENVYVFRSEYPEQIMKWNKNGSSTGEYLLGILENRIPEQEKNGVTLRQVYQQHYENNTLLDIPEIILQDEEIQVCLE